MAPRWLQGVAVAASIWFVAYVFSIETRLSSLTSLISSYETSHETNKPTNKYSTFPKPWLDQIHEDLKPFAKTAISRKQLDEACRLHPGLARIAIVNNTLFLHGNCKPHDSQEHLGIPHAVLFMILRVLCVYKLPDMELVLNYGDGALVHKESGPKLPIFSWSKTSMDLDIIMPYWSFVWVPWASDSKLKLLDETRWSAKKDVAFWRGTATGGIYTKKNWRTFVRSILVQKCNSRPDLCDAGIVQCSQCDKDAQLEMEGELGMKNKTTAEEAFQYKYIVMVDGNSAPSSRSRYTFEGDSLVLFARSATYEFYYSSLQSLKHYIALSENLDDLYEKIEWAKQHQKEAQEMVRNMQQFAWKYFNADVINEYMKTILVEYAKLLDFSPAAVASVKEYDKGRVWLEFHQENHFMNYMDGRCQFWSNEVPNDHLVE